MSGGLLSLQWNNHKSTLHHMLLNVRRKERYTDTTLACDGKLYPVHKFVLSMCSEYFEQIFAQIDCTKHPVIVLKDIKQDELECLLNYMYVGEVNVVQERLSGLIKAAECLRIKGLAVPDEDPAKESCRDKTSTPNRDKRASEDNHSSSDAKRRKQETNFSDSSPRQSNYTSQSRSDDARKFTERSPSNSRHRNGTSSISNIGTSITKITNNNNNSSSSRRSDKSEHTSKHSSGERQRRGSSSSLTSHGGREGPGSPLPEMVSAGEDDAGEDGGDIKTEETVEEPITTQPQQENLVIDEPPVEVKAEPNPDDDDGVYIAEANSDDGKRMMFDSLGGDASGAGGSDSNQMHFMEELLNQTAAAEQGTMGVGGDYSDTGEGASSSGQHIMRMAPRNDMLEGAMPVFQSNWSTSSSRDGSRPLVNEYLLTELQSSYDKPSLSTMSGLMPGPGLDPHGTVAYPPNNPPGPTKQNSRDRNITIKALPPVAHVDLNRFEVGPGVWRCPFCQKVFALKTDFKRHYMTHSGEKPFMCHLCNFETARKGNLFRHMQKMHSETLQTHSNALQPHLQIQEPTLQTHSNALPPHSQIQESIMQTLSNIL